MTTIFLLWTLWAGVPYDVDAFMDVKLCIESKAYWDEQLNVAKAAKPELAQMALVGCFPVEVSIPAQPEQKKESM